MSARSAESTIELTRPVGIEQVRPTRARDLEEEVLCLFDHFRDPLLRYVCAFGIPASDSEDLIQDVFLALFIHLYQDGSRSNIRGWLFRVAHNLALKRRARLRRDLIRVHADARRAHTAIDQQQDPEEQLAAHQRRTRLLAVLNALPERDRQCLRLRGDGLRYREIAGVLGISLGAVAKSITRSIARLQRVDEG